MPDITIEINPVVRPDQLWDFYVRNSICEVEYGKEVATRVLDYEQIVIGAFTDDELVGILRACFDGLAVAIMEFSLDLRLQAAASKYANGSLLENDELGIAKRMMETFHKEIRTRGNTFTFTYAADFEGPVYESLGFKENVGHKVFYIDERPYVDDCL